MINNSKDVIMIGPSRFPSWPLYDLVIEREELKQSKVNWQQLNIKHNDMLVLRSSTIYSTIHIPLQLSGNNDQDAVRVKHLPEALKVAFLSKLFQTVLSPECHDIPSGSQAYPASTKVKTGRCARTPLPPEEDS